jgi:hypothetical protein
MRNTALFDTSQVPSMACGFTENNEPFMSQNYQPVPNMEFGSGSIVSCASDMLQWLLYNMGRLPASQADFDILSAQQTQQQTPPLNKCGTVTGQCGGGEPAGSTVGMGWFLGTGDGAPVLSKDGGVPGFTSWMGFESWVANGKANPSGNGVVVLAAGPNASAVGRGIMRTILGANAEAGLSSS